MELVDLVRLTPESGYNAKAPTWRWSYAKYLYDNQLRKAKLDPWVKLAKQFYAKYQTAHTLIAHQRLANEFPGVYWAFDIYQRPEQQTRWLVEAYMLAEDKYKNIAARTGQTFDTIACYGKLFFDVAGRTQHWAWVLNEVLGPSVHAGLRARDYDLLWKLYGLLKGPIFLDAIIKQELECERVTDPTQLPSAIRSAIRSSLSTKALFSARTIPEDYSHEIILANYNQMVAIEQESGGGSDAQSTITTNIQKMLSEFGFSADTDAAGADLGAYSASACELRADELVAAAEGNEPNVPAEDLAFAFPKPAETKT